MIHCMNYLPIGGTNVSDPNANPEKREWREAGSPFDLIARHHGFTRVNLDGDPATPDPWIWSRKIGGLLVQQLFGKHRVEWNKGSDHVLDIWGALLMIEGPEFLRDTVLAWHSHGGATGCLFMAKLLMSDLPVPAAILSLDMPVRSTMRPIYELIGQKYKGPIVHVHSDGWTWNDRFRMLGNRFGKKQWYVAGHNVAVEGGHSRFLRLKPYLSQCDVTVWPTLKQALADAGKHI